MVCGEICTRTPQIANNGTGSPPIHKWPCGFYLLSTPLYVSQNSRTSTLLYFSGALIIHSNPYYLKNSSNLGNFIILIFVNLRSKYNTYLIFSIESLHSASLNVFCILRYAHHLMMGIREVVSESAVSFILINVPSTSSICRTRWLCFLVYLFRHFFGWGSIFGMNCTYNYTLISK